MREAIHRMIVATHAHTPKIRVGMKTDDECITEILN